MKTVERDILSRLKRSDAESHKGQNGRILIIAGSDMYHGSLLLSLQAASRIVDMVYVHTAPKNMELVQRLRSEIAVFIGVSKQELPEIIEKCDAILIGPGLSETEETVLLTKTLLTEYTEKTVVVDATSLWHVDPLWLHPRSIVTPHSREFENVFGCHASPECVHTYAHTYRCIVVLKGAVDYISDGGELWANKTGNAGMTKGGTGDVLAGLIAALAAVNDPLTAALAGTYLNGAAGDRLKERVGIFYNAEDLIDELGVLWKEMVGD